MKNKHGGIPHTLQWNNFVEFIASSIKMTCEDFNPSHKKSDKDKFTPTTTTHKKKKKIPEVLRKENLGDSPTK